MNRVKAGLFSTLSADATLNAYLSAGSAIYDTDVPQETDAPYVVFQKATGRPAYTFTQRTWNDQLYNIKAVTQGHDKALAGTIDARIDTLLTDVAISISGGTCLYLRRETEFDYSENESGVIFNHVGATYRIWAT